jgi:hypothetical protein
MTNEKESYHYRNYIQKPEEAKLKTVPEMKYAIPDCVSEKAQYGMVETLEKAFMDDVSSSNEEVDFEDIFNQKVELSQDRISLITGEIMQRDWLRYENLKRLYDDLLRIENWRLKRTWPQNYATDKLWSDMNRMELDIRKQIRQELNIASKDMTFPRKDLREGLLEFKLQNQKKKMVESGLEMELDSPYKPDPGGKYRAQK